MALFQDATEILDNGNNKQVKKIEDSNGNIIWGSQTAFPYRRLEYVTCDGNCGVNTGITPSTATGNAVTKFKLKVRTGSDVSTQQRIICNYTSGATYTRMYAVVIDSGKWSQATGSNWLRHQTIPQPNTTYTIESHMVYNGRRLYVDS